MCQRHAGRALFSKCITRKSKKYTLKSVDFCHIRIYNIHVFHLYLNCCFAPHSENTAGRACYATEEKMTLDKMPVGKSAVITSVGGEGALRCHLLDMGLIPKTEVKIIKIAPMGDPIELFLRGYSLTIRKEDARNIEVEIKENAK